MFYEASTHLQSLKHGFQLQFHLCQNNMRIITLQHKKKFKNSITLYYLQMESQEIFFIWLQLFSL